MRRSSVLIVMLILAGIGLLSGKAQQVSVVPGGTSYVSGQTSGIGGSLLAIGTPATGTATVTGVAAGRPCYAAPSDGSSLTTIGSGLGITLACVMTSTNTATVYLGVTVAGTPLSKNYNVVGFP